MIIALASLSRISVLNIKLSAMRVGIKDYTKKIDHYYGMGWK